MLSDSRPKRRSIVSLLTLLCFVAATAQALEPFCPPPTALRTLTITHDSATLAWNRAPFERNPLHCVCTSPGNIGEVCTFGKTPPDCHTNVTGQATVQQNLDADNSYTMCVQTQCSDVRFSSPVCKTFRTSLKEPSAQYQAVDAKRTSSSLDIRWRVPMPPKGRVAGYRLRWCQSSKCVTTENVLQGHNEQTLSPEDLQPYRQYTLYASAFSVNPSSGQKLYGNETSLIVYTLATYEGKESVHLQIKAVNSSTVLLSWPEPSGDTTRFQNHLVTWWKANQIGSRPATTQNKTIPATSTRFFIYDLEPGATYHIVLTREHENSGMKALDTNMHADLYSKPDAVHAEVSDSVVSVTWDASRFSNKDSSTQRYAVKMCPTCEGKTEAKPAECESIAVQANVGKTVFRGINDACQYKVEVRAIVEKPDGTTKLGEPAVVFLATTAALRHVEPDPYQKPDGLRTAVKRFMNASMVTVMWNVLQGFDENDSPVSRYAVKLCCTCDGVSEETDTECRSIATSASVAKAVFHGLKDLCEYRVEVRALVESVSGEIIEGEPAVTLFTTPPPNLPKLGGSLRAELHGSRVDVHWTSRPLGLDGYDVFHSVRLLGPSSNSVIESTVNGTEHTFTDLEPQTNYSLDVALCVARTKRRHCGANTTLEFQTLPSGGPSGNVSELKVTAAGSTELQLFWSSPIQDGKVTRYLVSWWRDDPVRAGTSNMTNFTVPGNETTMIIDGLEASTSYIVEVVPINERRGVTWRGSPTSASATTDPDGPPQVKNISITTANRTTSSSDILISWETTNAAANSLAHIGFHVTICIGADHAPENCRNQTVSGTNSTAVFPGVKNYATLSVTVQPFFKAAGRLIEGEMNKIKAASWTPAIPSVRDLMVEDITGTSSHVSWSEVKELIGIDGAYYGVVLLMHPEEIREDTPPGEHFVVPNITSSGQREALAPLATSPESNQLIVLNVTTRVAEIELHDLKPWTNYTLAVYPAISGSGLAVVGNANRKVFETPVEPPGKPRNVSVVERQDDHYLTWLPPESWNGPRSGYEVSITCMSGNVRANSTSVAISADKVELKIPRLSPGVPCSLGIYAYNVYQGDSLDGAKVRVKFTPPKRETVVVSERPATV